MEQHLRLTQLSIDRARDQIFWITPAGPLRLRERLHLPAARLHPRGAAEHDHLRRRPHPAQRLARRLGRAEASWRAGARGHPHHQGRAWRSRSRSAPTTSSTTARSTTSSSRSDIRDAQAHGGATAPDSALGEPRRRPDLLDQPRRQARLRERLHLQAARLHARRADEHDHLRHRPDRAPAVEQGLGDDQGARERCLRGRASHQGRARDARGGERQLRGVRRQGVRLRVRPRHHRAQDGRRTSCAWPRTRPRPPTGSSSTPSGAPTSSPWRLRPPTRPRARSSPT